MATAGCAGSTSFELPRSFDTRRTWLTWLGLECTSQGPVLRYPRWHLRPATRPAQFCTVLHSSSVPYFHRERTMDKVGWRYERFNESTVRTIRTFRYDSRTNTVLGRSGCIWSLLWIFLLWSHARQKEKAYHRSCSCSAQVQMSKFANFGGRYSARFACEMSQSWPEESQKLPHLDFNAFQIRWFSGSFQLHNSWYTFVSKDMLPDVTTSARWQNVASSVQPQLCPVKFQSCGRGEASVLCFIHILTEFPLPKNGTLYIKVHLGQIETLSYRIFVMFYQRSTKFDSVTILPPFQPQERAPAIAWGGACSAKVWKSEGTFWSCCHQGTFKELSCVGFVASWYRERNGNRGNQSDLATLEDFWTPAMLAAPLKARMPGNVQGVAGSSLGPLFFDSDAQSNCSENWLYISCICICIYAHI